MKNIQNIVIIVILFTIGQKSFQKWFDPCKCYLVILHILHYKNSLKQEKVQEL